MLLMHEDQIGFDPARLILNRTLTGYEDYRRLLDEAQSSGRNLVYFNNLLPPFVSVADVGDALTLLELDSKVAGIARRFIIQHQIDTNTIGMHIRKTDFGNTVDDEALFMQAQSSSRRFFICSDDESVNQRFARLANCAVFEKSAFPARRTQDGGWHHWVIDADGRKYPYNITRSSASVVEGLIDLLILSQTEILRTSGSTFLAAARLLQACNYLKPNAVAMHNLENSSPIEAAVARPEYIEYQFAFKGKDLKMAGRKNVDSDRAIIGMIFQREMFALERWDQTKALNAYLSQRIGKGLQPLMMDAGANIGAASLYFNQIYPGLKILAIEPGDDNAILAQYNLAGLDANVIRAALGKEVGVMYLNDKDFSPIAYRVGEGEGKPVESCTVASLLSSFGKDCFPFILKIDIEGGEEIVFSRDAPWLDLFPLVIIELHDWMLPFKCSSKNFYRAISDYDFDIINQGENTFCFNRRLLKAHSQGEYLAA
jgi:FkbM family methyltransferase